MRFFYILYARKQFFKIILESPYEHVNASKDKNTYNNKSEIGIYIPDFSFIYYKVKKNTNKELFLYRKPV